MASRRQRQATQCHPHTHVRMCPRGYPKADWRTRHLFFLTRPSMQPIHFTYLNRLDVERLALTDAEILAAVESALAAQGNRETVIEPRVHLIPKDSAEGHFNVLRGVIHPLGLAGVKVVGDFVNNYHRGLPSELAVLNLFDPETGAPKAILDATSITDMRTGAMTALGAKYLARKGSKVLAHIGARGTSYWNVRLLDHLFGFD